MKMFRQIQSLDWPWLRARVLVAGCALLLLSGCGFHLRGTYELPEVMEATLVSGIGPGHPLAVEIRQALDSADAAVVDDVAQATAQLQIQREGFSQRVLSVDTTGRVSEYELSYQVRYRLLDAQGNELVAMQAVEFTRDYDASGNVLGAGEEADRLREDMLRLAVRQMLRQLRLATLRPATEVVEPVLEPGTAAPPVAPSPADSGL